MSVKKVEIVVDKSKLNRIHRGSRATVEHVRKLLREPTAIVWSFHEPDEFGEATESEKTERSKTARDLLDRLLTPDAKLLARCATLCPFTGLPKDGGK